MCGATEGLDSDGRDLVLGKITFDSAKKFPFKLITENTDHVPRSGIEVHKKEQNKKNLEGSAKVMITLRKVGVQFVKVWSR